MLPAGATVGPLDVAALAARAPAAHRQWIEERLGPCGGRPVLRLPPGTVVRGDVELDHGRAALGQADLCAVLAEGDLTVEGAVLNLSWNGGRPFLVLGHLRADRVVKGGASLLVTGDLTADGAVVGVYNDGSAWVGGRLQAEAFITLDNDFGVGGAVDAVRVDEGQGHAFLVPEVFTRGDDGERELDWDALVGRAVERRPVVRADYGSDVSLHEAAGDPNPRLLRRVLERRPDLEARDADGSPALVLAARHGSAEHVRLLLAAGARPDAADARGRTALHEAATDRDPGQLELLLAAHAPVDAADAEGWTPLARACWADRPANAARLIAAGADPRRLDGERWPLLVRAADERSAELVQVLLGARVPADATDPLGRTALHHAAEKDHVPSADALLAGGAALEAVDQDGETPLLTAVREGQQEMTRFLLSRRADPAARDRRGQGALALALLLPEELRSTSGKLDALGLDVAPKLRAALAEHEAERATRAFRISWDNAPRAELTLLLVAAGADPNARAAGLPVLMMSTRADVAESLLRAGAAVDARDDAGFTPLLAAILNARDEARRRLVRLFLAHGADPAARAPDGRGAARLAAESGDAEVHAAVLAALKQRGRVGRLEELGLGWIGLRARLSAAAGARLAAWLTGRRR